MLDTSTRPRTGLYLVNNSLGILGGVHNITLWPPPKRRSNKNSLGKAHEDLI